MIKIEQKVSIYEVDGGDVPLGEILELGVVSHWGNNNLVTIATPKGKRFTVRAADLILAVRNAQNTGSS